MEPVLPCTELEFTSYVGTIFPSTGLGTQSEVDDVWALVQAWVLLNWEDAAWHSIVGDSLVPTIGSVSALVGQVETIANTAFPGVNCWAQPVQGSG